MSISLTSHPRIGIAHRTDTSGQWRFFVVRDEGRGYLTYLSDHRTAAAAITAAESAAAALAGGRP